MPSSRPLVVFLAAALAGPLFVPLAAPLQAQQGRAAGPGRPAASPLSATLAGWQQLDAPTAHESGALAALAGALPGWQRDAVGSLIARRGSGTPRRVLACAVDRPAFAVTQVTEQGYLRVHRIGGGGHPLFDQHHEAQQVVIHTARGLVPGVFGVANGHFAAQHRGDTAVVSADDLWLDVGASSRAEVAALGIRLLDPVDRRVPAWLMEGGVAGQGIGSRAGCAALVAAAAGTVVQGETIFLMTAQSVFGWPTLGASLARLGRVDAVTVVGGPRVDATVAGIAKVDSVRRIDPTVRYGGTLVELLTEADARALLARVASVAAVDAASLPGAWVAAPAPTQRLAPRPADAHDATAAGLKALADLPGVSGDEWRVREAVRAALPSWARDATTVDDAGNLMVAAGPERDTLVVMAHLDEVGWEVTAIARDGEVTLRGLGGVVVSAWEGQPAMLAPAAPAAGSAATADAMGGFITGVFVPRARATAKRPDRMTAWFGMDSATLVARGGRVGARVTSYKDAIRLGPTRFTGRAMDDRAGSLALLRAVQGLDPTQLKRRVLFVWSTEEEVGLLGAAALATRVGVNVQRIHSIDTFVSSDTPLESPHFAFAPLGRGPVLRGGESNGMWPPAIRAEVEAVARAAGIPLQVGLTQGGTDGTAFVFYGAPNLPLSWPGRYSHSPGEVLDLRDLEQLSRLIRTLVLR